MKLYLIEDYDSKYPELSGKALTDALVREILMGSGEEDPLIKRTPAGKPYLGNGGVFFSVSHTKKLFGCLVSNENAGLDLQYARPMDYGRLARRYFTEDERSYVDNYGEEGFFRLWTRKEALCKYSGRGLEQVLEKVSVLKRADLLFTDISPSPGLYGCCCTGRETAGSEEQKLSIIRI